MDIDPLDYSWCVPPPGDLSPDDRREYYKKSLHWKHILPQTIGRWRKFVPSKRIVLKELGRNVEEVSNEELAKFIISRYSKKGAEESAEKGTIKSVVGKKNGRRDVKVDDLLAEYMKVYEVTTPNDIDSLRQLCSLKLAIDDLELAERELLRNLKDTTKSGKVTEAYINSIVNARMKYSAEYRQLQTTLGIDRPTRDKAESDKGGADYMRQLMQSAADLLKSKSVAIKCPRCAEEKVILAQGLVLCHFPGWSWTGTCPRCSQPFTLTDNHLSSPAERKTLSAA